MGVRGMVVIRGLLCGLLALAVGAAANLAAGPGASAANSLQPQCGLSLRLDVHPERPAPGDEVVVIAGGEWRDSCVPTYLVPWLTGQVVRVQAVLDYPAKTGCLCVITPWRLSAEVGRLARGVYRVDLYTTDLREPGTLHHCASKWFAVGSELYLIYLPAILGSGEIRADQGSHSSVTSAREAVPAPFEALLGIHSGRWMVSPPRAAER